MTPGCCSALRRLVRWALLLPLAFAGFVLAQVCVAPGKDAPGTISGVVNRYFQGVGTLNAGATTLTLGAASGAAGTVEAGDLLLVIQMQGATIGTSNDERYGDNTGTANNRPDSSVSQASGYTALGQAGLYEFVRVTAVAGTNVTFTPALANQYIQNTALPRRTYQVIRVPQYPSVTIDSAAPVTPLAWTGLVGGVVAIDVAGRTTFVGGGPHIEASNRGFRGGNQGVNNSTSPSATRNYRSANTSDGGSKGEGIGGTPRYVQTSVAGSFDSGTRFSDAAPTGLNNGAAGYTNGDYQRGAPANAGGGGNSHNAAGGGGGNGGAGGNGGQTYSGDGLNDTGGYGGSRTPQDGVFVATRMFMGGGGGSGSLNDGTSPRGSGGNGGGIVVLRTGSVAGSGVLRADGQRGWDSDVGQDAGGGGGAGGTIMVMANTGHGSITAQARGGNGADSNLNTNSLSAAPPDGTQAGGCCAGEREGPGGGGGGGVVMSNAALGSTALQGGANGLSREDKYQGFSGNMRSTPGASGVAIATFATSAVPGVRPGFECLPVLTVSKSTATPTRTVPPNTTGQYSIAVNNAATGSGIAYGVALTDLLPAPFTLTGANFTIALSAGASAAGAAGPLVTTFPTTGAGTSTIQLGTPGDPVNGITLNPGAGATVTFQVALNAATAGTYQNSGAARLTDPTRATGSAALAGTNATTSPGDTNAAGGTTGGSNYTAATSSQEDIVVSGVAGTSADLGITKSGPASAEVGNAVQYTLNVVNAGPSNITGSASVGDLVPANIGTVTWSCSVVSGTADCDTAGAGTAQAGSGNNVQLPRVAINSGAQIQIVVSGTAAGAGSFTNTATVTVPPGFTDPNSSNNSDRVSTTITVPSADLSVTKDDGSADVVAGGVTSYTIVAANAGPSAADGAVVTDPAATGLAKLSISCSAQGGASCPTGLTTATFQAGVAIPSFPAGSTVTFVLAAQVTAASGTVTNTVSIAAPAGLTELDPANNSAFDAGAVSTSSARVVSAAGICPAGTTEQSVNLLDNSDFSDIAASVGATATQYPANTDVPNTGVAPQTGARTGYAENVSQRPFPGDVSRGVAAANNWLYSNGNNTGAAYRIWSQSVTGLTAGRTYVWMYYASNARNPGSTTPRNPVVEQRVTAGATTYTLTPAFTAASEAGGTSDTWTLVQRSFSATTTGVLLQLYDTLVNANTDGDNLATTQILLRECRPNAEPFVTKTNFTNSVVTLSTTQYVIKVGNAGPGPADSIVLKDPASPGVSKTGVSCAAAGAGAQCQLAPTVGGLEDPGLTIPALPANTTLTFTITASITALNGTVTNTASIELPTGMTDSNPANNSATDTDTVFGLVNLSISKTNNTGTVASGGTASYVIVVGNGGPSDAAQSVVQDQPDSGLSCTAPVVCNASGGASCGGPNPVNLPAASVLGGFPIPALPAGGQITLNLTCRVSANGF